MTNKLLTIDKQEAFMETLSCIGERITEMLPIIDARSKIKGYDIIMQDQDISISIEDMSITVSGTEYWGGDYEEYTFCFPINVLFGSENLEQYIQLLEAEDQRAVEYAEKRIAAQEAESLVRKRAEFEKLKEELGE
jgi:hypothetical protein